MRIHERSLATAASVALVTALGIAAVAACDGKTVTGSGTGGAANNDPNATGATTDAAACPSPEAPDGGFGPGYSFANGSVTGPSVAATFCNAGTSMSRYSYNGVQSGLTGFVIDSSAYSASSNVETPPKGIAGSLRVSVQLADPVAGVYTSADPAVCGGVTFSYGMLSAPGVDCDALIDGSPYTCPTGCTQTSFCGDRVDASSGYYTCCVPLAETFVYQASSVGNCQGTQAQQPVAGSWTLTLTSVSPFIGDAGQYSYEQLYTVHGSFTATVQGVADTTDTATISLTF